MSEMLSISVTEFKKRCLALLSDLQNRKIKAIQVTKRGKPMANIEPATEPAPKLFGSMKGRVKIPSGLDIAEIDVDEEWDAEHETLRS